MAKEIYPPTPTPPGPVFSPAHLPNPAPTPGPRGVSLSEEQSLPLGGWREQVTLTLLVLGPGKGCLGRWQLGRRNMVSSVSAATAARQPD